MKSKNIPTFNMLELLDFFQKMEICIVKVESKLSLDHSFNSYLQESFRKKYGGGVGFAILNRDSIDLDDSWSNILTNAWLNRIGLSSFQSLPSGFYLFMRGTIEGYHPATLSSQLKKDEVALAGVAAAIGFMGGAAMGAMTKNFDKGLAFFTEIFEAPQAMKVYNFFSPIIDRIKSSEFRERQKYVVKSEIEEAYELLGVEKSSTDQQIKAARNRLNRIHHPDKHPEHYEEKNKFISGVNSAYDLIMKSRETA